MNSRKGLLFHNWIAQHSNAIYLLKIDDDCYFRPAPFLEQLRFKSPFMYIWGYFDYISPVPRDPNDNFFNPREIYPYEVFPPYPRGVIRIVSMDVGARFFFAPRGAREIRLHKKPATECIRFFRQFIGDPPVRGARPPRPTAHYFRGRSEYGGAHAAHCF